MTRYAILEMAVIALITGLFLTLFPKDLWAVFSAMVITFVLLQLLSALRFCLAIHRHQVIESKQAPYRYTITKEAAKQWLVMHFIWCYLANRRT